MANSFLGSGNSKPTARGTFSVRHGRFLLASKEAVPKNCSSNSAALCEYRAGLWAVGRDRPDATGLDARCLAVVNAGAPIPSIPSRAKISALGARLDPL